MISGEFFNTAISTLSKAPSRFLFAVSFALYLVFFFGENPFIGTVEEDAIQQALRWLMLCTFATSVFSALSISISEIRMFRRKRAAQLEDELAKIPFAIHPVRKDLISWRDKVDRKVPVKQKKRETCSSLKVSSDLYAIYDRLHGLGIATPRHEFGREQFPIQPHLDFLTAIYPLSVSRQLREEKQTIRNLVQDYAQRESS